MLIKIPSICKKVSKTLKFQTDLECFASRLNTQVPRYVSYKSYPFPYLVDAFSVHQGIYKCYLFHPFSLTRDTLHPADQAEVMLVVSKQLTQSWYNNFLEMLCDRSYIVDPHKTNCLLLQKPEEFHQIWSKHTLRKVFSVLLSQGFDSDNSDMLISN